MRINGEITAPRVRLVGDNIEEQGIYPISQAMHMADELGLDLVEISAKADPPVCKIIDYQKFLYQQKKKAKEMKSNSAKVVIKEILYSEQGEKLLLRFAVELEEYGRAEQMPKLEGKRMIMMIAPVVKKK